MLELIQQHLWVYLIAHVAMLTVMVFGYIIAETIYWFIIIHVWAYNILKEVYHGIVPADA